MYLDMNQIVAMNTTAKGIELMRNQKPEMSDDEVV